MIISIPAPNWIKRLLIWIEFQFAKADVSQPLSSNVWIEKLARPVAYSSQVIKKKCNKLLFTTGEISALYANKELKCQKQLRTKLLNTYFITSEH